MNDRRNVLAALAAGAAALPLAGLSRARGKQDPHGKAPHRSGAEDHPPASRSDPMVHPDMPAGTHPGMQEARGAGGRTAGASGDYFPNVALLTHRAERTLFYSDLLQDKIVLIHFMSIANEAVYPVMGNMAKVAGVLGDRLGRDVFMYSVTVDPENDTPRALAALALRHGVGLGWSLLTGEARALEAVKGRFFVDRSGAHAHGAGHAAGHDCSLGLARYGNEPMGLWGAVAAKANPRQIAERLSWVAPRAERAGKPVRRGPAPLTQALPAAARKEGK